MSLLIVSTLPICYNICLYPIFTTKIQDVSWSWSYFTGFLHLLKIVESPKILKDLQNILETHRISTKFRVSPKNLVKFLAND